MTIAESQSEPGNTSHHSDLLFFFVTDLNNHDSLPQDINKENEELRARIREVEDENQELQAQSLLQNRTILGMRNELSLMRTQLNEMAVTSALLTERVRQMMQQHRTMHQQGEYHSNQITAPPLMAPPPPPPPPLSPTYIRISPRQVGAGEALMARLGLTIPTPQRHRMKRDVRQSIRRLSRSPTDRQDLSETPSVQKILSKSKIPSSLTKTHQLQGSFVCSQGTATASNESTSDSSDSEDGQQTKRNNRIPEDGGIEGGQSGSSLLHRTILQNYSFASSKFLFPTGWDRKDKDNHTLPSTSRNIAETDLAFIRPKRSNYNFIAEGKRSTVSECVQYTFPNAHEGSHGADHRSVVTAFGQSTRHKSLAKKGDEADAGSRNDRSEDETAAHTGFESESQSSTDDDVRKKESDRGMSAIRMRFDVEQDGFQADESSNCITSTENSLERVAISEADIEKN